MLWRLCRALFKISEEKSHTKELKENYINEAYNLISTALQVDDNNGVAHKWMAIVLNCKCNYLGMAEKIRKSENVRKHLLVCHVSVKQKIYVA